MFRRWLYPELRGFRHAHNASAALWRAHRNSRKARSLAGLVTAGFFDVFAGADLLSWFGVPRHVHHWAQVGFLILLIVFGLTLMPAYRRAIRAHLRLELIRLLRCPYCFFDLRGTAQNRCTECGADLPELELGRAL